MIALYGISKVLIQYNLACQIHKIKRNSNRLSYVVIDRQIMWSRICITYNDHIFIKVNSKLEKVSFDDILFAEGMENYVAIYTRGQKHITNITLKGLQEKLPANAFIQTHKSYIINIQAVQSIEGNILHIDKYQVPISKYQKEEVMEKMVNSKLLKKGWKL